MMPFAFEPGMGFERYADWALDVPMYFVKRGDAYHDVAGASFRDLLAGKLPQLPGERATISDWANHLSTLFPEVRLKRYLEMRGADAGPVPMLNALPAFWVGLLYDGQALDEAEALVADWTQEERQALRDGVPRTALATPFRKGTVRDVARDVVRYSPRRACAGAAGVDARGHDESQSSSPSSLSLQPGRTHAEALLALYQRASWARFVEPVFETERL